MIVKMIARPVVSHQLAVAEDLQALWYVAEISSNINNKEAGASEEREGPGMSMRNTPEEKYTKLANCSFDIGIIDKSGA